MSRFLDYLKLNSRWYAVLGVCGALMTVVMSLNNIPAAEIVYGLLLIVVFSFVVTAFGFVRFNNACRRLMALKENIRVSIQDMPPPQFFYEKEYQDCIETLFTEKNNAYHELQNKEHGLMEYYTMWVHQIKTPIAALKLLLEEDMQSEDGEDAARILNIQKEQQELFQISEYVNMALQYMRLDTGVHDFVFQTVSLDTIIRQAIHKYAGWFVHKKLKLVYTSTKVCVLTDEKWIVFAVEQLLSNAVKYTKKGSITISVFEDYAADEAGIIQKQIHLKLVDTGIGIRKEDLPRVCEKGYTGYNRHENRLSTGIGLYLCKSVLDKLGHSFLLSSDEGKGTCAEIIFTLAGVQDDYSFLQELISGGPF